MKIEGVMNSRDGHIYNPNKRHEITTFMTTKVCVSNKEVKVTNKPSMTNDNNILF